MAQTKMALGTRPAQSFEKKLVGLVEVITGKTKAKFTLTEEGKTFKNGETSITVNFADLPAHPKLKPEQREPKVYRIRMSQDGSEIEAIQPALGHYKAKLVDLGKRPEEGADPIPYEKVFGEGTAKESRHFEFFAVYEITEGAFKGVQLPAYNLHYKFEEDEANPGFTRFAGNFDNAKSTRLFQLRDWGLAHGLWNEPIEWDDVTILPTLLDRALQSEKIVDLTIKDGYIRELLPVETDEEEEFDPLTDKPDSLDEELPEFLKEPDVKPVVVKSVKANGKVAAAKPVVKKVVKKSSEEDDEL